MSKKKFRKVTLNLYEDDVLLLKDHYETWGGFSAAVRTAVQKLAERVRLLKSVQNDDADKA